MLVIAQNAANRRVGQKDFSPFQQDLHVLASFGIGSPDLRPTVQCSLPNKTACNPGTIYFKKSS
jgi:hypothetical protein